MSPCGYGPGKMAWWCLRGLLYGAKNVEHTSTLQTCLLSKQNDISTVQQIFQATNAQLLWYHIGEWKGCWSSPVATGGSGGISPQTNLRFHANVNMKYNKSMHLCQFFSVNSPAPNQNPLFKTSWRRFCFGNILTSEMKCEFIWALSS